MERLEPESHVGHLGCIVHSTSSSVGCEGKQALHLLAIDMKSDRLMADLG